MTKEQHPITLPSPELRAKWRSEAPRNRDAGISREDYLMDRAAIKSLVLQRYVWTMPKG